MDADIIVGLLALVGVLAGNAFMHGRWTREQDIKRQDMADRLSRERREEQRDLLDRMAEQHNTVVENAVRLAEVHQEDAEKARLLALDTAAAHAECRQEVAMLSGKVEELRARITENERTMGDQQRVSEDDRNIKHDALTALTISEGTVSLVQKLVPNCTCDAFVSIDHLVTSFHPRASALVDANSRLRPPVDEEAT